MVIADINEKAGKEMEENFKDKNLLFVKMGVLRKSKVENRVKIVKKDDKKEKRCNFKCCF